MADGQDAASSPVLAQPQDWRANHAGRAVWWTYWFPLLIGAPLLLSALYLVLLSGNVLSWMVALPVSLGLALMFVVAVDESQRHPRSVSIGRDVLRIRHGLRSPWHETAIPWRDVERFSLSVGWGALALVVHHRSSDFLRRLKHQSWYLDKDLIEMIERAHTEWGMATRVSKGGA